MLVGEDMESVKIKNLFLLECSMHSRASSMARASACLEKLKGYCDKWGLTMNTKKTQFMIMSAGNATDKPLMLGEANLEYVNTYKYLGITISRNGNIKNMMLDRVKKARKAIFAVTQALETSQNVSVKLAMSVEDSRYLRMDPNSGESQTAGQPLE